MGRAKRKKDAKRRAFISFAALFPLVSLVLITAMIFLPCMYFTSPTEGVHQSISHAGLMSNSFETARYQLFSAYAEDESRYDAFAGTVLSVLAAVLLLYLALIVYTVFVSVGIVRYIKDPTARGRERALFLTLCPHRALPICAWVLALGVFLFPRTLPLMYFNILGYYVTLDYTFEPLILWGGLLAVMITLSAISRKYERLTGFRPFDTIRVERVGRVEEKKETNRGESSDIVSNDPLRDDAIRRLLQGDSEKEDDGSSTN